MRSSEKNVHSDGQGEASGLRRCDRPGCMEEGLYRAPRSREALNSYYWFCLEHVREYNLAWDYFKDMDEDGDRADPAPDAVWQRPSWPFAGASKANGRHANGGIRDPFGFFRGGVGGGRGPKRALSRPTASRPRPWRRSTCIPTRPWTR